MRGSTDTRVRIHSGDSPRLIQHSSSRRLVSQDTSPDDLGAVMLKPRRVKRRRPKLIKRHQTLNVSEATMNRDSPTVVPTYTASSSSVNEYIHSGFASTKRPVSGKIKLYTRVLLPLTLFIALIGAVSFLWIPPRHARRPYSSLVNDDYPIMMGSSSKSHDSVYDYIDQSRRLRASGWSSKGGNRGNSRSLWTGSCFDKGGPNLCSRPNACTKHPLLCKCTCSPTHEIQ
jgi:hypothetical protein